MLHDFFIVSYWWLILLSLGLVFLPLTVKLFARFWDKGWIFSKILGIVIVSYLIFLGGRLHFLPFFKESIFLIILLFLFADFYWLFQKDYKKEFKNILKKYWRRFLFEEIIFFFGLVFWSFVRGFQPNIEGLEKFMDFGFVNSILRSTWFPPVDMWFTGESINYYYFGHLQAAVLTKLSGLDPAITYNLLIAAIFSLTFTAAFSLTSNLAHLLKPETWNLKPVILAGLISALLLALGGNLHAFIYALKDGKDKYWYPDATRFIGYRPNNPKDKTIHEFPIYSFVVADLHGHMNDIPTVLLFLAVLLVLGVRLSREKKLEIGNWKLEIPLIALLLAAMYMTNSWDFFVYGVIYALFSFVLIIKKHRLNLKKLAVNWLGSGLLVLFGAIIFSLPFSISFEPMAKGIAFVHAHSLWWQLLILWGFFWFVAGGFWTFLLKSRISRHSLPITDLFIFSATFWATILIIIPEIIYVKDIYISEYHRANTMFKLTYQSFIIYSLSAGYIFWRVKNNLKSIYLYVYISIFLAGFAAQLVYPYFAVKGYYGSLKNYSGLYGMNFLKDQYPDDYQAVLWLKKNIDGQPVVLEAVGDSYTLYNRVSAMTGLPTIEGWLVHEWLWRGGYDKPGARAAEVETIYQEKDEESVRMLLQKYKVEYIFVGSLEREKYPDFDETRFAKLGKQVFSSGETKIYYLDRL